MEQTNTSPFKPALTYGIYLALINIVILLIIWAANLIENLGLMGTSLISLLNLTVMVIFLVVFTKLYRDKILGGKITFRQAFAFGVLIVVCSSLISSLFSYILNRFIDPGYAGRIMTAMQEKTYQMLSNRGVSDDQIETAMRTFEEKGVPTPLDSLQQAILGGFVGGAIMSLISSAIVKKNTIKEDAFDEAMEEIKTEDEPK